MYKSLFFIALFAFGCKSDPKPVNIPNSNTSTGSPTGGNSTTSVPEPVFTQEGVLEFHTSNTEKALLRLKIEIAHDSQERQQGLMYRKKMADNEGMLFIFEYPEPQSFWMRNTYIPLDIIYLNEKFVVVTVLKNIPTLNDDPRPSGVPAQYVVEINAGLSDKHGIKPGCTVSWADFVTSQKFGKESIQTF
jgi:uncharacterized membrane protein (UPF0127 family)